VAVLGIGISLAACSSGSPSKQSGGSGGATSTTSTTADLTAAASAAYGAAYNTMQTADNAGIDQQNSSDQSTQIAGINARVQVRQTFDTAIQAIQFPTSAQTDAKAVLSADVALETALGDLSVNVNDTANYNSVFQTVSTDLSAFAAADAALSSDLGLTNVTTTTG